MRQLHPGSSDSMSGHNLFMAGVSMVSGPILSKDLAESVRYEEGRRDAKRRSEAAIRTELMSDPKAVKQLKQLLDDTSDRSRRTMVQELVATIFAESGIGGEHWSVLTVTGFDNLRGADGKAIKNPTVRDLLQRLIDTGGDRDQLLVSGGKVPFPDLRKEAWDRFTDGMDLSTPETFMASLLTRNMVQGWAESSSHTWPAIRNQQAAAKVHGVSMTDHLKSREGIGPQDTTLDSQLRQSMVRAEYAATQKFLRETLGPDVTSLRLYRGIRRQHEQIVEGADVAVEANPLSSWSTSRPVARSFAEPYVSERGTVLLTDVPLEAIQSTPFTGRGCLNEFEVVVVGHPATAKVSQVVEFS